MSCRESFAVVPLRRFPNVSGAVSFSEGANRCISGRRYVPVVGTANLKMPEK